MGGDRTGQRGERGGGGIASQPGVGGELEPGACASMLSWALGWGKREEEAWAGRLGTGEGVVQACRGFPAPSAGRYTAASSPPPVGLPAPGMARPVPGPEWTGCGG